MAWPKRKKANEVSIEWISRGLSWWRHILNRFGKWWSDTLESFNL